MKIYNIFLTMLVSLSLGVNLMCVISIRQLQQDRAMHVANWYMHDDLLKGLHGKDYGYASKYALVQIGNKMRWVRK